MYFRNYQFYRDFLTAFCTSRELNFYLCISSKDILNPFAISGLPPVPRKRKPLLPDGAMRVAGAEKQTREASAQALCWLEGSRPRTGAKDSQSQETGRASSLSENFILFSRFSDFNSGLHNFVVI